MPWGGVFQSAPSKRKSIVWAGRAVRALGPPFMITRGVPQGGGLRGNLLTTSSPA